MRTASVLRTLSLAALSLFIGCSMQQSISPSSRTAVDGLSGQVHGGQQAVSGAMIQLFTVGTTGDGSASRSLLTTTVSSDANGSFTISPNNVPLYNCSGATQVYLVATGGNPGIGSNNANIGLMAALGACSSLSTSTFVQVNELTTVAAVEALAPFMNSAGAIGSGPNDVAALNSAFALAAQYVNLATGSSPGSNVPTGYSVPTTLLNTLADVLASCVNTVGYSTSGASTCGTLFTAAGLSYPALLTSTTIDAMLSLAHSPSTNVLGLYSLIPPFAPFQPTAATVPPSFSIHLSPTGATAGLTVDPLNFGMETEFAGPRTVYASLFNFGTTPIVLNGIGVTGVNASDFSAGLFLYNGATGCPPMLQPNAYCLEPVTFTPQGVGSRSAYLVIVSNAAGSPLYVPLTGIGTANSSSPANVFLTASSGTYPNSTGEILTVPASSAQSASPSSSFSGAYQSSFGPLKTDKYGNIYAIDENLTTFANTAYVFSENPAGVLTQTRSFTMPSGLNGLDIAADSTGRIFVPYQLNTQYINYVGVFPANASGSSTPSFNLVGYGYYVAVDPSDNLYAMDVNTNIYEFATGFTASSSPSRTIDLSSYYGSCPVAGPYGMNTDSVGNVYVVLSGGASCAYSILEFGPTGTSPVRILTGSNLPLQEPGGIAVDANGTIYVSDQLNGGGGGLGTGVVYEWASATNGNAAPTSLFFLSAFNGAIAVH